MVSFNCISVMNVIKSVELIIEWIIVTLYNKLYEYSHVVN